MSTIHFLLVTFIGFECAANALDSVCCFASLQSGVLNGLAVIPSVYDEDGKWLSIVNGGYATLLVVDQHSKKKVDEVLAKKIGALFEGNDNEDRRGRPVGIELQAKTLLLIQDEKGRAYAVNFQTESYSVYRLAKVSDSVYQFDYTQRGRTMKDVDLMKFVTSLTYSQNLKDANGESKNESQKR